MISTAGVKRDKLFLSHENEDGVFFVPRIVFPGMKPFKTQTSPGA